MGNFRKFISTTTAICFYFASATSAQAELPPLSLSQMYNMASAGNVRALRAAGQRGLNIDATDRNGDTGLCYAIKRNNSVAYNAFRAAGANPRHGCTQNIPRQQYDSFMNSTSVAGINETPRGVYNQFNDGEYIISTKTWVIGGILLLAAGAGIALAAGGGGGGGGGGSRYTPTNDSLGDFAAKLKPYVPSGSYSPVVKSAQNGNTTTNTETMSLSNADRQIVDPRTIPSGLDTAIEIDLKTLLAQAFSGNILQIHPYYKTSYVNYMQVAMKAFTDSTVINDSIINLDIGTIGMVALGLDAEAINNNLIQINSENGTIGMVASEEGKAINDADILIAFDNDDSSTYQIYGMYADTAGQAINTGNIKTINSNETIAGTLYGMQGRIINQEASPFSATITNVTNALTGDINLSSVASSGFSLVNLIGLGSTLDQDFVSGKKLLSRAGSVILDNYGSITIKQTLLGDAAYNNSIRSGSGGLIGIRADGNTTAYNRNGATVDVEVEANDATKATGTHAGMVSIHGGTITNEGTINIKGGTSGYGMVAIRGNGTNSEFDLRKPTLTNSGAINIDSVDGFGIASFHGGNITNALGGQIVLDKTGTGIHSNAGTINNNGSIILDDGGKGITVIANPVGEGSSNYDTANTVINNTGSVTINKAIGDSYGIYTEYGRINNSGNVTLENVIAAVSGTTYGLYAYEGTIDNSGKVKVNINNSGESYGIYSEKANVNNYALGEIEFTHYGYGIYSGEGRLTNYGKVTLNGGGFGLISTSGNIYNRGSILITGDQSVGVSSETGTIENISSIKITGNESSGIESGGIVYNGTSNNFANASIELEGKDNTGILVDGTAKVYNYGKINIKTDLDSEVNTGISASDTATVNNYGTIRLEGNYLYVNSNYGYGITSESGAINNRGLIDISGFYGYGITTNSAIVRNYSNILIANGGFGIKGEAGSSIVNEKYTGDWTTNHTGGYIGINGTTLDSGSYGIYTTAGSARNDGYIKIDDFESYGIFVSGKGQAINQSRIDIDSDDSVGMGLNDGGTAEDDEKGIIINAKVNSSTVGVININGNNGYGMLVKSGKAYNMGDINLNGDNGIGIFTESGEAENSGKIESVNTNYTTYGMVTESGKITNTKNASISLFKGIGMQAGGSSGGTGGEAINNGTITIAIGTPFDFLDIAGMQAIGGGSVTNGATGKITTSSAGLSVLGAGSTGTNLGEITANSASYGIYAADAKEITNSGKITVNGSSTNIPGYGMYSTGDSTIINNTGIINNINGIGIFASGDNAEINNSGALNVGAGSAIYGEGENIKINNTSTLSSTGNSYVIYANGDNALITNSGNITTGNGYALYAKGNNAQINNTGKLTVSNGWGIYIDGTGAMAVNNKSIDIGSSGVGMYAINGATVVNGENGTINLTAGSGNGLWANGAGSQAVNRGTITGNVQGSKYGMQATNGATVINDTTGIIKFTGSGYGMWANGPDAKAINHGTIDITYAGSGTFARGIYATNGGAAYNSSTGIIYIRNFDNNTTDNAGIHGTGTNTKVYNEGSIYISTSGTCTGENCNNTGNNRYIYLSNGATFETGGLTYSSFSMNFNDWVDDTSKILVQKGGKYEAPDISGTVYAGSTIVQDSFDKSYVNENSFVGEDSGIDLMSDSYLFNARLEQNEDGGHDVVMTMKEFGDVVENEKLASYLDENYSAYNESGDTESAKAQSAITLFNALKGANNQNGLTKALNNELGLDFFPSLARQNLEAVKSLNRQVNNTIFANEDPREVVAMMGYDYLRKDQEASGAVEGYDEDANSIYGLVQKRHNNNFSYGAGVTITVLKSKYDNGSKRDDKLIHLLAPLKYQSDAFTFVSVPRVGYGWGDYDRVTATEVHSADTKNYYYGITNEIRKDFDLGFVSLEPTAEFNVLGVYQSKTKEHQQLTVKSSNSLSVEGGIGLYAKRTFNINEDNKIKVRVGGTFYQEFGDTYANSSASRFGLNGLYNMKGYESDKSRGIVSGRLDYLYKDINFFAEASKLIERDGSYDLKAGVEIKF